MPSTRSGFTYNASSSKEQPIIAATAPRRSPRHQTSTKFFEPIATTQRPQRTNRATFSEELLREICDEQDNDSTSDYEFEEEEVQQYIRDSFTPIALPRYEVNIDFDEASAAWRSNKRRVGESWVYKRPTKAKEHAASLVSAHIANSIASRVKENRRAVRNA